MLQQKFSMVVEKTARELAGTPCLELEEAAPPKQEICCSRIFGKRLTELTPIKQALVTYTGRFAMTQPVACDRLMTVLDEINGKYGRGTMRTASVPRTPDWGMRREMMSRSYTTRIDQLWRVFSR